MNAFPTEFVEPGSEPEVVTKNHRDGAWRWGEEPNRAFNSRWYAMHHPDWVHYRSPFDHFLRRGLLDDVAPSPLVDMVRFRAAHPDRSPRRRYARLVAEGPGPADGIYADRKDLRVAQQRLLASIEPHMLRCEPGPRRHLVMVQHGDADHIRGWSTSETRSFDVLLNHYDGRTRPTGLGDIEVSQVGTKFTANHKLTEILLELFCHYRYVWLLDDDVLIDRSGIEHCLRWCEDLDAPLAQPTLSHESSTAWSDLRLRPDERPSDRPNPINGAEIMMPIMRIDFWLRAVRYFPMSISGYGLDLLWAKMLEDDGSTAWRLPVIARHDRAVDVEAGAYYTFLRSNNIVPDAEWWCLVERFGLERQLSAGVGA